MQATGPAAFAQTSCASDVVRPSLGFSIFIALGSLHDTVLQASEHELPVNDAIDLVLHHDHRSVGRSSSYRLVPGDQPWRLSPGAAGVPMGMFGNHATDVVEPPASFS